MMLDMLDQRNVDDVFFSEFSSVMSLKEGCAVCRKENEFWHKRLILIIAMALLVLMLFVCCFVFDEIWSFFSLEWFVYIIPSFSMFASLLLYQRFVEASVQYRKRTAKNACREAYCIARRLGWTGREEMGRLALYFQEESKIDWEGPLFSIGKVVTYITVSLSIAAALLACLDVAVLGIQKLLNIYSLMVLSVFTVLFMVLVVCLEIDFFLKFRNRNIRMMQSAVALRCALVAPDSVLAKWDREICDKQFDRVVS